MRRRPVSPAVTVAGADQTKAMQQQMSMGGQVPDVGKAFDGQMEALEIVEHKWHLDDVEARLIESLS